MPGIGGLFDGIASAFRGARPLSLEDCPGMLAGTATIVADAGQNLAENAGSVALQRETYIVDVVPTNGTDPALRAEAQCWVSWLSRPMVGDKVPAAYAPGTKDVARTLAGHPEWDWLLAAATRQSDKEATRAAILDAPPGTEVPPGTADWSDPAGPR